jgi:predicted unusual protein kinase regulating ubiquinone biosynthesis (AarF/ABC1/UbiB family)
VYKGVLRETGELVAVKVQRPGIGESIAVDMLLLRRLMAVVDKNLPQVSQQQLQQQHKWLAGG